MFPIIEILNVCFKSATYETIVIAIIFGVYFFMKKKDYFVKTFIADVVECSLPRQVRKETQILSAF